KGAMSAALAPTGCAGCWRDSRIVRSRGGRPGRDVVRSSPRVMPRYPSRYSSSSSFSFGPGPVSTALKALIGANVAVFFAQNFVPQLTDFGLQPEWVVRGRLWQLGTYMFLHGGPWHILFNMLALWMFGAELERS